jgi:hypothetical protein
MMPLPVLTLDPEAPSVNPLANPSYVQSKNGGALLGGNAGISSAYTNPQTAGNSNIVFVSINNAWTSTITDTAGNTYTSIFAATGSGNWNYQAFAAFNIAASPANTVTINFSAATPNVVLDILEYTGSIGGVDVSNLSFGTSATPTSASITPAKSNELVLSWVFCHQTTTLTIGAPWTVRSSSTFGDAVADNLSVGGNAISASFTSSAGSVGYGIGIVAFSPLTPALPSITPIGGHYEYPTVVRMSCATPGATIYYTTDGSTPTTASTAYSGPVPIGGGVITLNAISAAPGLTNSPVVTTKFYVQVGGLWKVTDDQFNITNGLRIWQFESNIMYDPNSGYWYKIGNYYDTTANMGDECTYRSADLFNWEFRVRRAYIGIRTCYLYNALNNNYVLWGNYTGANSGKTSFVSSSPEGPWTQVNYYETWQSVNIETGDSSTFLDPNTGLAYLITTCNNNANCMVIQLSPDFLSLTNATNYQVNGNGEAPTMWTNGPGSYFFMQSGQTNLQTNFNAYRYGGSPLTISLNYNGSVNPFPPATITPTPEEVAAGITPTNNNAYNTQTCQVVYIPGRKLYLYHGDRYNAFSNPLPNYRRIILPLTHPTPSTTSIPWTETWNLNAVGPTVSGAPVAASGLLVSGTVARWKNNEPKAAYIYLDSSPDGSWTSVVSEVVPPGATSFSITPSVQPGPYFRIRTVNANGSTVSIVGLPGTTAGNPPFMPVSFPAGPPTQMAWEDGPGNFVNPSNSPNPVFYNGQNQTAAINTANPRPPTLRLPAAADRNTSKIK